MQLLAEGSGERAEGWGRYVAAVAAELAELGRPPVGISGELTSTLPAGAGLSSSAALEIAVATALCAVAGFTLEVTTPELDRLVELAYAHGAVAARTTGAGFGGAVVALVAETRTTPFVEALPADYRAQGRAYVCRASDEAGLHS